MAECEGTLVSGMKPSVCENASSRHGGENSKSGCSPKEWGALLQFSANTPPAQPVRSSKSGDGGYYPPRERHIPYTRQAKDERRDPAGILHYHTHSLCGTLSVRYSNAFCSAKMALGNSLRLMAGVPHQRPCLSLYRTSRTSLGISISFPSIHTRFLNIETLHEPIMMIFSGEVFRIFQSNQSYLHISTRIGT